MLKLADYSPPISRCIVFVNASISSVILQLQVERQADAWEDMGDASLETDFEKLRPLVGTVTSCDRDGGFINQTTFFPRAALCEGG